MHLSIGETVFDLVAAHVWHLELMTFDVILHCLEIQILVYLGDCSVKSLVIFESLDATLAIIQHQIGAILGSGVHCLPLSLKFWWYPGLCLPSSKARRRTPL